MWVTGDDAVPMMPAGSEQGDGGGGTRQARDGATKGFRVYRDGRELEEIAIEQQAATSRCWNPVVGTKGQTKSKLNYLGCTWRVVGRVPQ